MSLRESPSSQERIELLLRKAEILSPTSFRFGDGPVINAAEVPGFPNLAPAPLNAAGRDHTPLRNALATVIYFTGYARTYRGEATSLETLRRGVSAQSDFLAELGRANPTENRWEPGWRVFQLGLNGAMHIHKGAVAMLAQPGQYAFPAGAGHLPSIGDLVDLFVARESMVHQPGMYYAFGETVSSDYDMARIGRLYFNVPAEEAAWLLKAVGALFNRYLVPFRLKCSVDPRQFDRSDGFVVYLGRRYLPIALQLLSTLRPELERRLRPEVPLCSKPLLMGVGAADDPADGESFGQSRSKLIADAVVETWESGRDSVEARQAALEEKFRRAGLSLSQPHLAAGLVDCYALPLVDSQAL